MEEAAEERRKRLNREAAQRYRAKHPERVKASAKKQYDIDPAKRNAAHKKWYAKNKDVPEVKAKANALARKSYANRNPRKLIALAGRPRPDACEVCGDGGKICFDHCHATEEFRGWLCQPCNLVLGHAKDNPVKLRKLADYLEN